MTLLIVIVIIAFTSSIGWPSLVANSSQSIFASSRMIFSCDFLPTPKFFIICKANRRCLRHSSPFPHNIPTVEAILIRISNYQIVIKILKFINWFFFRINAFDADIAGIKKLRLQSPSSHVGTRIFLTKGLQPHWSPEKESQPIYAFAERYENNDGRKNHIIPI